MAGHSGRAGTCRRQEALSNMSNSREDKPGLGQPRGRAVRPDMQPLRDDELPCVKTGGDSETAAGAPGKKPSAPGERREPAIGELPEPVSQPRKAAPNRSPRKTRKAERKAHRKLEKRRSSGSSVATKRRRKWPWVLLALVVVLFLVTWIPVLVMRWADPPTTAFMLETAVGTDAGPIKHTWVNYDDISPAIRPAGLASEGQTSPH